MNFLTHISSYYSRSIHTSTERSIRAWKWCMSMAKRCTTMHQLKTIHAMFITHGIHWNNYAVSHLLNFCALSDSGDLSYASLLFSQLPSPNIYVYNAIIKAYSMSSTPHVALSYFNLMLRSQQTPDGYTFPFVLVACSGGLLPLEWDGKKIHCWLIKNGLAFANAHVQTALIRFYSELKLLDDAHKMLDDIGEIDAVQCNVLISSYIKGGMAVEALNVFQNMLLRGVEPDLFCLTSALTACAKVGALEQGKWIHDYVRKMNLMTSDTFLVTQLVDMYAKCGCIDIAKEIFEGMPKRNNFSWGAMIGGFAGHGFANNAIECLERMQVEDGIKPDGIVILEVLAACTHAGLTKEGQSLLNNMESLYGVPPEHGHYSCVVDLLCRSGQFHEALEVIHCMPMKPGASVWGALLSGCRVHNNLILAEFAVKKLLEIEDGNEAEENSAFVQLSNVYLSAKKVEDARRVRKMIGDRGLKKSPGCSSIEINGKVNEFVAGDVSHYGLAEIFAILEFLSIDLSVNPSWQMKDLVNQQLEVQT